MHKLAIIDETGIITNLAIGEVGSVPNSQFISNQSALRIGDRYEQGLAWMNDVPPRVTTPEKMESHEEMERVERVESPMKSQPTQSIYQKIMTFITKKPKH